MIVSKRQEYRVTKTLLLRSGIWSIFQTMKAVTISEAKAKLSGLVEAAQHGEQVLIMRGSKPAVTLMPVQEEDLVIWPRLRVSDRAADALLSEAKHELAHGTSRVFDLTRELRRHAVVRRRRA